ncbi:MAG: ABC transporter substrate-binding protein [Stackebrandtia sp.]
MTKRTARKLLAAAAVSAVALTTACTAEPSGEDRNENEAFVFGVPDDPRTMDPVFDSGGETFRVTRQVFDTLLDHKPGGTELEPGLAEKFTPSEDGLAYEFQLREGVTFHDGAELDGEAVCANFDRWYNFEGAYQDSSISYYWNNLFGSFAKDERPEDQQTRQKYKGCTADGMTATIEMNEPSANFPAAFSMATTAILSPKTLESITDDQIEAVGDPLPDYTQMEDDSVELAGTGPFKLKEWDHGAGEVKLERFDDYWGDPAKVKNLIFKAYDDENALKQALESGNIHGYDLAPPAHAKELEDAGYQVPKRDVFNILYLAFQQETSEDLGDKKVRQALAHAVNRQNIVDRILPEGGEVATQFMPDTVGGWSEDVATYDYDAKKAEDLLKDAGAENLKLDFCWPTDVSRPYMPSVKDIYESVKSDLEAVGVTVEEKPMEWADYIPSTSSGECSLYLLGWTGDFNEGYNFIGTWFDSYTEEFGMRNDEIFDKMAEADAEPDPEARDALLAEANVLIMDELPGLPISSSPPSMVFAEDVEPPTTSPLTQEDFAEVSFK